MIVLDTHAWVWSVSQPSNLSRVARQRIGAETRIGVSAISCFEIATLVAKGRISLDRDPLDWLEQALALPKMELLPLTPAIAVKATQLGNDFPGDRRIELLRRRRFLNRQRSSRGTPESALMRQ